MNRFFYNTKQRTGQNVCLDGEDAHHLLRVLRIDIGESIELCNEQGVCQRAEVTTLTKHIVCCKLSEQLASREPQTEVDLAFGLLKGEKTAYLLQKATELGVHRFLPFTSERTVVKKQEVKTERRQKIVRSAAAQSHRSQIPEVFEANSWEELLRRFADYDMVLLFWERELEQTLAAAMGNAAYGSKILLVTGPEGGLSENEIEAAKNFGAKVVTLGSRILRAETAAITAAALVLYQAGEMGGR